MSEFWNACWHSNQSQPDTDGDAICFDCGKTLRGVVLTKAMFMRFSETALRQGYHSMRCVRSDLGWVCAADCPSMRATSP